MAEPEEVTVRSRRTRVDPLRFGEVADQEIDRLLSSIQDDLLGGGTLTGELVETTPGQVADEALDSVEVRAQRALAAATPQQRGFLLGQVQQMVDFVAPQVERLLRLTGTIPEVLIDRYGADIVEMATEQVRAAEAAAAAAARAAAEVLPEVVVRGASTAGRVAGSGAFGIASLIPEAIYRIGQPLSDAALDNAIRRLTPPPAPPPPREPEDEDDPAPVLPVPDSIIDGVTVSAPRAPRAPPVADPVLIQPRFPSLPDVSFSLPEPDAFPPPTFASPLADLPTSNPRPAAPPLDVSFPTSWPAADPLGFLSPSPTTTPTPTPSPREPVTPSLATPNDLVPEVPGFSIPGAAPRIPTDASRRRCDCPRPQKKKRKKKSAREVCYAGTYIERATSLSKQPKRKVPCR